MEFIPNILKKVSCWIEPCDCWIEPCDGIFFKKKNHENLFNEFSLQNNNVSDIKNTLRIPQIL
jgi:hypothetical protein